MTFKRGFRRRFYDRPYLLLTLTSLMWAGNAVAGRAAIADVSPMVLVSLRWILVCAILLFVSRRETIREWPAMRPHLTRLILMGMFGFTGFNALFYLAAHHTTAVNIAILQGVIPVVVLLGTFLVFKTAIGGFQMAGVALTLLGVAFIASSGDLTGLKNLSFNIGDVWMLTTCLFYAGYALALRGRPPVSGLAFFSAMAVVAFLTSLPLLALEAAMNLTIWPNREGWLILFYIALFPSFLSQLFFIRGVELIGPGRAGLFVNLVPVFGALLAVLILGEPFRLYHAIALMLVLGGIVMAEKGKTS